MVILGNETDDVFTRNKIKLLIVDKLLMTVNCSMFFLINKFRSSQKILKEAYAELIMIFMKDNNYCIDDIIIDEIISLVSLDTLIYYGAESKSIKFRDRCKEEFWSRAILIEDKMELKKKGPKRKRKNNIMIWKGDKK